MHVEQSEFEPTEPPGAPVPSPAKGFASRPDGLYWTAVLAVSLFAQFAASYLIDDPVMRAGATAALLAPIIWAVVRITQVDALAVAASAPRPPRRFGQLRSRVVRMLEEIKRLNWLAVDAERGVRDRDDLLSEMDDIENRLNGMIEGIRQAAGRG